MAESLRTQGAVIMGRKMFSGGEGPWDDDPNADGWWGDEPPFRVPGLHPHASRARAARQAGPARRSTSSPAGIEEALEQARAVAGDNDVLIAGGGEVAQQYLRAGLLDEIQIHLVPVFLGSGVRLFDGIPPDTVGAGSGEGGRASPGVTHLRFRVTS